MGQFPWENCLTFRLKVTWSRKYRRYGSPIQYPWTPICVPPALIKGSGHSPYQSAYRLMNSHAQTAPAKFYVMAYGLPLCHIMAILELFKTGKVSTKLQVSQLLGFSLYNMYNVVKSVPDPSIHFVILPQNYSFTSFQLLPHILTSAGHFRDFIQFPHVIPII